MTAADPLRASRPAGGSRGRGRAKALADAWRIAGVLGLPCLMGCVSTPQGSPPGSQVRQIFDPAPCEFRATVTGGPVASETGALAAARNNVAKMGGNAIFVVNVESRPWTFRGNEMPPYVTVTAEAYWCGGGPN
jgi:hypothetical protein